MTAYALAVLSGCLTWALMARGRRAGAARRHRMMARHPMPTFVFADLVGYTTLTERCGDDAAVRVAREFRRVMSLLSRQHGAWHVKSMGDGAMIWVPDAAQAVALAERTLIEVGTRPDLLPVRVGAHTGPAVLCEDDWYGGAVNVAARLAGAAQPNEALVSDATHEAAGARARRSLRRRDVVGLRGMGQPIGVWPLAPDHRDTDPRHEHALIAIIRGTH
jgi:class 3 adenylate cyclase